MRNLSKFQYRLIGFVSLGFLAVIAWWVPISKQAVSNDSHLLQVQFLAVGQGDAIFITTPDGVRILIDGGPDYTVVGYLMDYLGWFDRVIDVVIATHPDLDHIGGLLDVLDHYQVNSIMTTKAVGESQVARLWQTELKNTQVPVVYAEAGQVLTLGASTTLTILSPQGDPSRWESNASSIIALLQYGDVGFMLTGDAPAGTEQFLTKHYGEALEAEVLKLGHHGSKTSSANEFLTVVAPQFAVVSAGKDNSFGHPHEIVLERVAEIGARVVSTQNDHITFHSDGQQVWLAAGR